ncbi:hypothetical protein PHISP_03047 [Aspergillus sp. HF37]|nr:hypothetical protein PHISP_03047 [Aspergillus sp. HF37]
MPRMGQSRERELMLRLSLRQVSLKKSLMVLSKMGRHQERRLSPDRHQMFPKSRRPHPYRLTIPSKIGWRQR